MIKFLDLQKINQQYASELKNVAGEVIDELLFGNVITVRSATVKLLLVSSTTRLS